MGHYFGAHADPNDLIESIIKIKKAGGNIVQFFVNPAVNITLLRKIIKKNKMRTVIHSSYMHNIAKNWDEYSWWIKNIENEIKYAYMIKSDAVILHLGKMLKLTQGEAYNNMYTGLLYIHNLTKKYQRVKILLETSAGQGTELCQTLEDLAYFYKKISTSTDPTFRNRIKLCIDTCHIFAAGYDLKTKRYIKKYFVLFEKLIGIRNIYLIHLNDSMSHLGENKDRHENIGKGKIGLHGLSIIFNYFKTLGVPIILETPNGGYQTEINLMING